MAVFYSRRGNWGWNPNKKWGSVRRKTRGNYKAAKQTRDSMNMVIKANKCFSAFYQDGTSGNVNHVEEGTAVINIYDVLRENPQFQAFIKLYDQIKVNGVKVKLNIVDANFNLSNQASLKNINVVTAWDRTGLSREQVQFADANNNIIAREDWDISGAAKFFSRIGKGIVNATGVDKSIVNAFQRWNKTPFIYPSTMEEKGCYLSTSNFENPYTGYNYNEGVWYISTENDNTPITELFNSSNPVFPFESPSCKWKPTLYVGVFKSTFDSNSHTIKQYDNCDPILFNAEFSIDVTFRNMKASQ